MASIALGTIANGTPQADNLIGTAGDDTINGLGGDDILDGGLGDDELFGGEGSDELYGDVGNDKLAGDASDDGLYGGLGKDLLDGGLGNDELVGDAGDDELYGGEGIDDLYGEAGNDTLDGGEADNTLSGGEGNDTFKFNLPLSKAGIDRITDFTSGADKIELSAVAFPALNSTKDFVTDFQIVENDDAASTQEALIVYSKATGNLFYNPDRTVSGLGEEGQLLTITDAPDIKATDFSIIDKKIIDPPPSSVNGSLRVVSPTTSGKTFQGEVNNTNPQNDFGFTIGASQDLSLSLDGLIANANVEVLNIDESVVASSNNPGTLAESINTRLEAGSYIVRVTSESSTNYSLNLSTKSLIDGITNDEADGDSEVILNTATGDNLTRLTDFRAGTPTIPFSSHPEFKNINGKGWSAVVIDTGINLNHPFLGACHLFPEKIKSQ